ncbi:Pantothenate synthetase [metagenome]|uniref:pantoate--beta-alanine ligase (AMP-forming) n=1 Tax=metagenome TaxID=256318 RepID=A0A2P2C145_9ZZZZ
MTTPTVVLSRAELAEAVTRVRARGGRVALVPTMGALHEGHATLIRAARAGVGPQDAVVVSIFVNPLQFGPHEDLSTYPRTLEADLEVCAAAGADLVFVPSVAEVYPGGDPVVTVDPGPDTHGLEGAVRPGHFRGVATVVAKLLGLVAPDLAFFGEKDYEQLALIRQMVSDLCMGVEIVGVPTVREPDGLAMSSRNRNLSPAEHASARSLSQALRAGAAAGSAGGQAVLAAAGAVLAAEPSVQVDYLALRSPDLGDPPLAGPGRLLVAARVGTTRLIDNLQVELEDPTHGRGTP